VKRLTLFRHGKAATLSAGGGDFDRPLTSRGEVDTRRVAEVLQARLSPPDYLLSSPAARAAATARIVATVFNLDEAAIAWEPDLYLAAPATLLAAIRQAPVTAQHVLLTGHNPGLEELAGALLPGPPAHLPTAGAVSVTLELPAWSALPARPAAGTDPLVVFPRGLRG